MNGDILPLNKTIKERRLAVPTEAEDMTKVQIMMLRYAAYNRIRDALAAEGIHVDPLKDKCACEEYRDAEGNLRVGGWGPSFYRALEACGVDPKEVGAAHDRRLDRVQIYEEQEAKYGDRRSCAHLFEDRKSTCFYIHDFLEAAVDVMTAPNSSEA